MTRKFMHRWIKLMIKKANKSSDNLNINSSCIYNMLTAFDDSVKLFNNIRNVFTYKTFYRPSTRSLTGGWILSNVNIILNCSNSNKSPDDYSPLCKLFSYLDCQFCPKVNWILPSQYIINYLLATILFLIFFFFFFYSLGYLEKET